MPARCTEKGDFAESSETTGAADNDDDMAVDNAEAVETAYAEYLSTKCGGNCSCSKDGKPCGPLCGCMGLCGNKLLPDFETEGIRSRTTQQYYLC